MAGLAADGGLWCVHADSVANFIKIHFLIILIMINDKENEF
jgi:hypothetical protein